MKKRKKKKMDSNNSPPSLRLIQSLTIQASSSPEAQINLHSSALAPTTRFQLYL